MNVVDRRRNLGPANTQTLIFDTLPIEKEENNSSADRENSNNQLYIQLSNIPTALGSTFLQSNSTILTASVYGPRPNFTKTFSDQASLKISFNCSTFLSLDSLSNTINISATIQSNVESSLFNLILLENYPKSNIDIFINLISLDPTVSFIKLMSLIFNTVNLALIDSGLALKGMPSSGYNIAENTEICVNSIHGLNYTDNDEDDEELLSFCGDFVDENSFKLSLEKALIDAKQLRMEFSQLCLNSLK